MTGDNKLIYKKCKARLLEVYGPKPDEDFKKGLAVVMTGLPSEAAKDIRALLCEKDPPLKNCCCHKSVGSIWRDLLPPTVKAAVAGMDLKENFENTVKHADSVYNAIKTAPPVAVVTPGTRPKAGAAAATAAKSADLDTSADAPALDQVANLAQEIAAFNKNFKSVKKQQNQNAPKSGNKGAQGVSGASGGKPQSRGRGKPHPDGPPDNACIIHWRHGRGAFYCLKPGQCPWEHIIATPK